MESGSGGSTRTPWLALLAMGASVIVIANDFSAINVAIPTMEKDFHTNVNTMQWVINAYALTFGVLIVTGGRLADMFGRRRAFFLGTAIFASMSALGGAAPTETWLIATRVLMGVGGALMWPAILGMTYEILPEEKAGLAGGIIIGAAGLGNARRPSDRRRLHRPPHLALDLLRQRPGGDLRGPGHLPLRPHQGPRARRSEDRLRGGDGDLVRPRLAADRPRPGRRLGMGRPEDDRAAGAVGDPDRRLPPDRAPGGPQRPDPQRSDRQRELPRLLPGDPLRLGDVLRLAALPAAVHAEAPRIHAARGRGRDAPVPRDLRRRLVHRRPALQPARGEAPRRFRGRLPDDRAVRLLDGRHRLRLRLADPRDGHPRVRDRDLLPDRDHRRRHLGRRIPDQPRGRDRLHVPDRRAARSASA